VTEARNTALALNSSDDAVEDEMGCSSGKLYGICVVHPRLLKTSVLDPNCVNASKKNVKYERIF